MQKHFFWVVLLLTLQKPLAQQAPTDQISGTLLANANLSTTVVFPTAIKQAVCGSENFRFAYDAASNSNVGLLKGTPGSDSNLLVITSDDILYSFVIQYANAIEVAQLNHFITKDKAIGSLSKAAAGVDPTSEKATTVNYPPLKQDALNSGEAEGISTSARGFCAKLIASEPYFMRYLAFKNNLVLRLNHINYHENELYLTLRIENNSAIDYQVNFMDFFIAIRKPSKKSSVQPLPLKPLYSYNVPKTIPRYATATFVYVFKKVAMDRSKTLVVELSEREGDRNVRLTIPANDINRAKTQTFTQ